MRMTPTFKMFLQMNHEELKQYLTSFSNEELHDKYNMYKSAYEYAKSENNIRDNLIADRIDNPGFEHLIEMCIQETPDQKDIIIMKTVIDAIEEEISNRECL